MEILDDLIDKPKYLKEFARVVINQPLMRFYEKLSNINARWFFDEPIEATKTLQWKAGIYDKTGKMINRVLFLNKKPKNIAHQMQRTYDKSTYNLRWMLREFDELERLRARVRSNKLTNDDIAEQSKSIIEEATEKISLLCDGVNEINRTYDKIQCVASFNNSPNWQTNRIRIDFLLTDLNIVIYTGKRDESLENDYKIANYNYPDSMIVTFEFRVSDLVNGNSVKNSFRLYGSVSTKEEGKSLAHPFISLYNGNGRGNHVCLDNFQVEAFRYLENKDLPSLARLLLEWSQFYHMTRGNPYNHIRQCIEGYPESVREIMHELAPDDGSTCAMSLNARLDLKNEIISKMYESDESYPDGEKLIAKCDDIGCIFKDKCRVYQKITKPVEKMSEEELLAIKQKEAIEEKLQLERFHRGG